MKDSILVLFWGAWHQTTTNWQPLLTELGPYAPVVAWHDESADHGLLWQHTVVETFSRVIVIDERSLLIDLPADWIVWQGLPELGNRSAATLTPVINHTCLLLRRRQGGRFKLADFIAANSCKH